MRKKSKGLHAIEPSKNINFPYICILIIFILFFTFVYFKFIHFNLEKNYELPFSDYNNSSLSSSQQFENSAELLSKDFFIDISAEIPRITGTIENISDKVLESFFCNYVLFDNYNNVVYEFKIHISKLDAHESTSFSSICTLDLSNVVKYSVTLIK